MKPRFISQGVRIKNRVVKKEDVHTVVELAKHYAKHLGQPEPEDMLSALQLFAREVCTERSEIRGIKEVAGGYELLCNDRFLEDFTGHARTR
ncbi:MAG: hypothetical protein HYY56_04155 [Candidatus Omnitrophica bacterium]|nr:hypothetical protein [Candidatus Omnitrophota bacterium]